MKWKLQQDSLSHSNVDEVTQTLHDVIEILKKNLTYEEQINAIITGRIFFLLNSFILGTIHNYLKEILVMDRRSKPDKNLRS